MFTAPPNRYTNTTISITGSSSAVSSASGLRADKRRLRPVMISASDMGGLLAGVRGGGGVPGGRRRGKKQGQGEEDVVEGRAVDGEALEEGAAGVGLVQQGADTGGAPVGGHTDDPRGRVQVRGSRAEVVADLDEGFWARAGQVQPLGGYPLLE